ncbi:SDR family NAD(P)-dependent oxidoreductase [Alteromonas sp. ASW11-130]|uniref:SDR family NAD(P)-dependent oxidoreductase n=1 Tax=Alteromonas sp. ASW11-130 TaxID=3015775 RepID=UPI002241E33B|nr:SDR family oxidoreductase [Alteromonas sp. ASW11-130]MCW8091232.1 SDR family oxidoreductase [Alteromonas sp. ASW11-130]
MKNFIVSGGSTGIGRAVIESLINQGNAVINLDIKPPQTPFGGETFIKIDLADYKAVKEKITLNTHYDGLFLNVGIHRSGSIFSQSLQEIETVLNTNLLSNIAVLKALENNFNENASIVFNGSDQCFVGKPNSFAYGLTKGAIAQMTKSLALDLVKKKIRVNTVCPSTTETPLYRQAIERYAKQENIPLQQVEQSEAAEIPLGRVASTQEVADVVLFLLSDASRFMTGSLVPVDGGYTAK